MGSYISKSAEPEPPTPAAKPSVTFNLGANQVGARAIPGLVFRQPRQAGKAEAAAATSQPRR